MVQSQSVVGESDVELGHPCNFTLFDGSFRVWGFGSGEFRGGVAGCIGVSGERGRR